MSQAETIRHVDAAIDYLVPTSRINRRFWAPGVEYNTGVYQSYPVRIGDARQANEPFDLDVHGFRIGRHVSAVADFHDAEAVARTYPGEVAEIIKAWTGADLVATMGAQLRCSGATGGPIQPPAAEAHVDFNTETAERLARRLYERIAPDGPGYDRFIAVSLWRTFSPPPQDWPLALCDYRSVADDEGVPNVKVDVDEIPTGEALFAPVPGEEEMSAASIFVHRPAHRWWYFPDMTRDEAVLIKFHDSDHSRAWRALHTAFPDPSRPGANTRESIEFRAVAYFSKA